MILILYSKTNDSKAEPTLLADANKLKTKVDLKNAQVAGYKKQRICTETELAGYLESNDSQHEVKIHIFGHGNWEQLGPFKSAVALADYLVKSGLHKRPRIASITLHACYSAAHHPNQEGHSETFFVYQFLQSLVQKIALANQYNKHKVDAKGKSLPPFKVRGAGGPELTGPDGRSWVLKPDTKHDLKNFSWPNDPKKREALIQASMLDRKIARPVIIFNGHNYSIKYGDVAQAMDDILLEESASRDSILAAQATAANTAAANTAAANTGAAVAPVNTAAAAANTAAAGPR